MAALWMPTANCQGPSTGSFGEVRRAGLGRIDPSASDSFRASNLQGRLSGDESGGSAVATRPTPDSDPPNPGASKQSNTVAQSHGLTVCICRAVRLMQFTLPSRIVAFGCTQIPH